MKLSSISNLLARSFIVFILAYLWLSFYLKNIILVFVISFVVMLAVNYLFILLKRRKNTRAQLTRKQQEHMRQVMLQLKFMSREKARALFKKAFTALDKEVSNFYPLFNIEVTTADIIKCLRYARKDGAVYIASEKFSPDVVAFAKALQKEIVLLDAQSVYEQILVPAETFPEVTVELKGRQKLTWQELRQIMFQRAKVRPYIIIGIVILLTSFIVSFSIYYIVVATIVFSFALISLFARDTLKSELF